MVKIRFDAGIVIEKNSKQEAFDWLKNKSGRRTPFKFAMLQYDASDKLMTMDRYEFDGKSFYEAENTSE